MTTATPKFFDDTIEEINRGHLVNLPEVEGLTSPCIRTLLNLTGEVCENYLEIGVHLGATLSAAMYGNPDLLVTAIDNWQPNFMLDANRRPVFEANMEKLKLLHRINIIEGDFLKVDLKQIPPKVDFYFYDGDHSTPSQRAAISYYLPAMAKKFVFMADDSNWEEAREGTRSIVKELGLKVHYDRLLKSNRLRDTDGWWEGLLVMILEKP